jgi:tetratricopeptide (TPR) repeat protein
MVVTLNKLGDGKLRTGDMSAAQASYDEALATVRRLVDCDPGNAMWQWDLWYTLYKLGDAKISWGDRAAARGVYAEAVTIVRGLVAAAPGNAQRQTDLVVTLYRVASVEDGSDREQALKEALDILDRQRAEGSLTPDKIGWPDLIREMLAFFP